MASWVREIEGCLAQSDDTSECLDTYRKNLFELFESVINQLIKL